MAATCSNGHNKSYNSAFSSGNELVAALSSAQVDLDRHFGESLYRANVVATQCMTNPRLGQRVTKTNYREIDGLNAPWPAQSHPMHPMLDLQDNLPVLDRFIATVQCATVQIYTNLVVKLLQRLLATLCFICHQSNLSHVAPQTANHQSHARVR